MPGAKHRFVSGIADGGDATLVQPSNWNDFHDIEELGGNTLSVGSISAGEVIFCIGTEIRGIEDNEARNNIGVGSADSPHFTAIEIGHATDTTLARSGAGDLTVEGNAIYRAAGTDVVVADGGTGASTARTARRRSRRGRCLPRRTFHRIGKAIPQPALRIRVVGPRTGGEFAAARGDGQRSGR